jgi:hypothetical protein
MMMTKLRYLYDSRHSRYLRSHEQCTGLYSAKSGNKDKDSLRHKNVLLQINKGTYSLSVFLFFSSLSLSLSLSIYRMVFAKFAVDDLDEIEPQLPTLDKVVTVKNCIYYLSLLEQFAHMLDKFKGHLDAFHARAEWRYDNWVFARSRRETYTSLEPPLDVAYILHAHLLSPHRYLEDIHRLHDKPEDFPMPLEGMVRARKTTE